ncbi:MAG: 4-alpha-glucanotransferase [bacterium]|nr:4-alpha-glucanotransferase [bacterium]
MITERRGGILLHPSSLPSEFGIGDLGEGAFQFLQWLFESKCRLWQILPLNPPGYGASPYAALSAFAGNPLFISPTKLYELGLLNQEELNQSKIPEGRIDFSFVEIQKRKLLTIAFKRFVHLTNSGQSKSASHHPILTDIYEQFQNYCQKESYWLENWSWYIAFKESFEWKHWRDWGIYSKYSSTLLDQITDQNVLTKKQQAKFEQFLFDLQWSELRTFANLHDIQIIGDMPLFVSDDSADFWSHPELFETDTNGYPIYVAGVPPDYFSATGQLWGNPVYRWSYHQETNFDWWINRFRRLLCHCDFIRIDHFRGLSANWSVPYGSENAIKGVWAVAPGKWLIQKVLDTFHKVPLIAEDLGLITPDVIELRDHFQLPGMKILQFAFFGNGSNSFLPHHYPENCVAYTGTHDNNTTLGWYETEASEHEKDFARRYLGVSGHDIAWDFIRAIWRSNAHFAITPMQDILSLPSTERMNTPGTSNNNWSWRLQFSQLDPFPMARLRDLNEMYSRVPIEPPKYLYPDNYPQPSSDL